MGPVAYKMLEKLVEDNPNGESGFRQNEIATSAITKKWVKLAWESKAIKFFAITDEGRAAYAEAKAKKEPKPKTTAPVRLTEAEVRAETDRLLGVLEWARTDEGIAYHVEDKGTSHVLGVLNPMIEDLVNDAVDRGYNPAWILGMVGLRIWGQHFKYRKELKKLIDFEALNKMRPEFQGDSEED